MIYFYAEFTPDTMTSKPEATNGTAAVFAAVSERKNANAALKKSILNCFFRERQLMIPEISRLTGYSIPTVARYIHDSLDAGLVIASKTAPETPLRGRKATWYTLNPDAAYFLGVDTKHYALVLSLMNLTGEVILNGRTAICGFPIRPSFSRPCAVKSGTSSANPRWKERSQPYVSISRGV